MDVGTQHESDDLSKWEVVADGHLLRLRPGFRARCTFGAIYRWAGELLSPPYTTLARVWHT
eukprot:3944208-Prymnesium_polylepis.1